MTDNRDRLLMIMNNLEADYKSGKISAEKYSYFRSKYEDKLNSLDAQQATMRIRSMQGKPSSPKNNRRKRSKSPAGNKKKQEQDLVQKYIINPKKDDVRYNKKKQSSDGGSFKLILLLILVIAFTAGIAYGVFNLDSDTISDVNPVATVQDTAFPEIKEVANTTNTSKVKSNYTTSTKTTTKQDSSIQTTTDSGSRQSSSSSSSSSSKSSSGSSQSSTR